MAAPTRLYHQLRVQLFTHPLPPASKAVAFDLLGRTAWHSAGTQNLPTTGPGRARFPVSRGDVRQFRLDNRRMVEEDWEDIDDDVSSGKIPALIPGYQLDCSDNLPSDWQDVPLPEEQKLIKAAKSSLEGQIADLKTKIANIKPPATVDEDDLKTLVDLEEELDGLRTNGFLEAIPGAVMWGDDATGVYRRLSTANVPFRRRSRFTLEQRPLTMWLWRAKPRPGQQQFFFQVDVGARIRLVFESDDRATLYRKNETRPAAEFEARDAEWQKLRAKRDLTPETVSLIQNERDAIAKLRADARNKKVPLSDADKAQIKALTKLHQDKIKKLQGDKGLTDADKERLKDLEAYLFRRIETLELSNTGDSLVDQPFALTFLDSGVGFVEFVLDIGSNSYTFEDTYTTSRRLEGWMWGNKGDRIELRSSGGACAWRFGYVKVNTRDELRMAPVYLGEIGESDGLPVDGKWQMPEGTNVAFSLEPTQSGWFQPGIIFTTDGQRMPIVFRAVIQKMATPSSSPTLVWDSVNYPAASLTGLPSLEEDRSGALWQVNINSTVGLALLNLPTNIRRRIATVWMRSHDGISPVGEWEKILTEGVVVDDNIDKAQEVIGASTEQPDSHHFATLRVTIRDKGKLIEDSRFDEELELDNLYLGEAIYRIRRNMGASDDELSLLPRGAASGWKLAPSSPGERAAYKPSKGQSRKQYLVSELVERFGLGRQYYIDKDGRDRLELPSQRADSAAIYRRASDPTANGRRIYYEGDEGIARSQTLDRFRSIIEVRGAVDPDTKKRRVWLYELKEAVSNPNSPFYIGTHLPLEPVISDAYTRDADLEAVGRSLKLQWCRVPVAWSLRVPYSPDVIPGAVFPFQARDGTLSNWRITKAVPDDEVHNDQLLVDLEPV